jgi:hypothetical protein
VPLAEIMQREGMMPSEDPGALKVTISKFYRPSGASTQLKGVVPDFVVPSLTDIREVSEADLDNPLPWDTIPSAKFSRSARVTPAVVKALQSRSVARTAKDPAFSALLEEKERLRKQREEKTISLNEAQRKKEKAEAEARIEARKKQTAERAAARPPTWEVTLKTVDAPGIGEPVKTKPVAANAPAPNGAAGTTSAANGVPGSNGDAPVDDDVSRADDLVLGEGERILLDLIGLQPAR